MLNYSLLKLSLPILPSILIWDDIQKLFKIKNSKYTIVSKWSNCGKKLDQVYYMTLPSALLRFSLTCSCAAKRTCWTTSRAASWMSGDSLVSRSRCKTFNNSTLSSYIWEIQQTCSIQLKLSWTTVHLSFNIVYLIQLR